MKMVGEMEIEIEIEMRINGQKRNIITVSNVMKFACRIIMYLRKKKMEMEGQMEVVDFSMVSVNL